MIKIILTEDHSIVRNGIKLLLESHEHFCVIGEASKGKEPTCKNKRHKKSRR